MPTVNYYAVGGVMLGEEASGTGVRRTYAVDALGSVTGTVMAGVVENSYAYKPYGSRLAKTGAGADPDFQWVGTAGYRYGNRTASSHYVRARHYNETTCRWTTVDPIWPSELPYAYVEDTPVQGVDFAGLQGDVWWPKRGGSLFDIPFTPKTHPCSKNPCKYSLSQKDDNGYPAWVVCCLGKYYPCVNDKIIGDQDAKDCALLHERFHIRLSQKLGTREEFCHPGLSYGVVPVTSKFDECRAYAVEARCLKHKMRLQCGAFPNPVPRPPFTSKLLKDNKTRVWAKCAMRLLFLMDEVCVKGKEVCEGEGGTFDYQACANLGTL